MSESIVPGYDPNNFEPYSTIKDILARLKEINPLSDSIFELAHLNREAARLVRESNPERAESILQGLFHTCNKKIRCAAIYEINEGRINDFNRGIEHTQLELIGLE